MNARCYATLPVICLILSGCMFKPVTVSTRHFTLTPMSMSEPARGNSNGGGEHLSVGIGFVKMPSYLLRNSMIIRNGPEIEYLEGAVWSERLDESFQRDLAANLAELLPSDVIYLSDWAHDEVAVAVYINVQQYDVEINGHGTLIAQWRITAPGSDVPLKSGRTRLDHTGPSPRGKPEVIAETLSDLAAQFSRDLAQSIREAKRS
jgi:uncharacterized lipoprotein YmbA